MSLQAPHPLPEAVIMTEYRPLDSSPMCGYDASENSRSRASSRCCSAVIGHPLSATRVCRNAMLGENAEPMTSVGSTRSRHRCQSIAFFPLIQQLPLHKAAGSCRTGSVPPPLKLQIKASHFECRSITMRGEKPEVSDGSADINRGAPTIAA